MVEKCHNTGNSLRYMIIFGNQDMVFALIFDKAGLAVTR